MNAPKLSPHMTRRSRQVAYHEAGHAVVAWLMEIPFTAVAVYDPRSDDTLGEVTFNPNRLPDYMFCPMNHFDRSRARNYLSRDISMTLAGPVAQSLHARCWQELPMVPGDDEWIAYELAEMLYSERARQFSWINRLRFQTLELLQRPEAWDAVQRVANALISHRKLTAKQCVRAIPAEGQISCTRYARLITA
jgi:hypothetical protein